MLGDSYPRRPGNGTGPIGEGEQIGGFAKHISGSHESTIIRATNELGRGVREKESEKKERRGATKIKDTRMHEINRDEGGVERRGFETFEVETDTRCSRWIRHCRAAANFQGNSINTRGFVPLRIDDSSHVPHVTY